jgi:hypothetical protein
MPLQTVRGPHYIKRSRIFINPDDRIVTQSKDQFDYTIALDTLYENVTSIELVNYNIRSSLQKTFMEEDGRLPANNLVDLHLEDVATGLEVLDFSVEIPPVGYNDATTMATALTTLFNDQMDAEGHAFFNTTNTVVWTVAVNIDINVSDIDQALTFTIEEGGTPNTIIRDFLFATGENTKNNASVPLGFPMDLDSSIEPTFRPELFPFRYVDVFIKEFNEHSPVARIFLTNDVLFVKKRTTVANTRLLTEPRRRLEEMHVQMYLPRKRKPPIEVCDGVDLVFELLQISPEPHIPSWVDQQLKY